MRKKIPRKEIRRILYIELEQLQIAPHSWGFLFGGMMGRFGNV